MEERLNNLEIRLSFQEDTIDTLSDLLIKQQAQIDSINLQIASMGQLLKQLLDPEAFTDTSTDQRPPHY